MTRRKALSMKVFVNFCWLLATEFNSGKLRQIEGCVFKTWSWFPKAIDAGLNDSPSNFRCFLWSCKSKEKNLSRIS